MKAGLLLDTHIWLWYAIPDRRLKPAAREAIDARVMAGEGLHVSIIMMASSPPSYTDAWPLHEFTKKKVEPRFVAWVLCTVQGAH